MAGDATLEPCRPIRHPQLCPETEGRAESASYNFSIALGWQPIRTNLRKLTNLRNFRRWRVRTDTPMMTALFARKASDADAQSQIHGVRRSNDHPHPRQVFPGRTSWRQLCADFLGSLSLWARCRCPSISTTRRRFKDGSHRRTAIAASGSYFSETQQFPMSHMGQQWSLQPPTAISGLQQRTSSDRPGMSQNGMDRPCSRPELLGE